MSTFQFDPDVPQDVRVALESKPVVPDGMAYMLDHRGRFVYDLLISASIRGQRRVRLMRRTVIWT